MKSFFSSLAVTLALFCMVFPVHADMIPLETPDPIPSHNDGPMAASSADMAFFAANPDASQTAAGLTLDEFLYGTILLAVVAGAFLVARARLERHRN